MRRIAMMNAARELEEKERNQQEVKNNAYRFNPFYRNVQFPVFQSNPNAELPKAEEYGCGMFGNSPFSGFDWLSEENNTGFTYDDAELDMMMLELQSKGYC